MGIVNGRWGIRAIRTPHRHHHPPRRRRRQVESDGHIQMDDRLVPPGRSLLLELIRETNGRDLFVAVAHDELRIASETCVRYRLSSLAAIRQADRGERRMFLTDLRDRIRTFFPEMHPIMQLLTHFAPNPKQRAASKDPICEEVVTPERIRAYSPDLHTLGAPLFLISGWLTTSVVSYLSGWLRRPAAPLPSCLMWAIPLAGNDI